MGDKYLYEVKLPALLTVTRGLNTPRLPTLRDVLKARKKQIEIWDADALAQYEDPDRFGIKGSKTIVMKVVIPGVEHRKGIIFRGEDAAEKLLEVLKEGGIVKP